MNQLLVFFNFVTYDSIIINNHNIIHINITSIYSLLHVLLSNVVAQDA